MNQPQYRIEIVDHIERFAYTSPVPPRDPRVQCDDSDLDTVDIADLEALTAAVHDHLGTPRSTPCPTRSALTGRPNSAHQAA